MQLIMALVLISRTDAIIFNNFCVFFIDNKFDDRVNFLPYKFQMRTDTGLI